MPEDTTPTPVPPKDGADDGHNLDAATLLAKLQGTQGRLKQVQDTSKAREETWSLERQTLTDQLTAAQKATVDLGTKIKEYEPVLEAKSTLEVQLKQAQSQVAKQDALMKHPTLLRDDLRALVLSSTLEGEALDGYLTSLAEAFKGAPAPMGGTPPPPVTPPEKEPAAVMDEALALMGEGKTAEYEKKMMEYWQLLDKKGHNKLKPPVVEKQKE